jgi:hypothetical protein
MAMVQINVIRELTSASGITATQKLLTDLTFTQAQVDQADILMITCGADVYYTLNGDVPAAPGHILKANTTEQILGNENIKAIKLIRAGAADVSARITLGNLKP